MAPLFQTDPRRDNHYSVAQQASNFSKSLNFLNLHSTKSHSSALLRRDTGALLYKLTAVLFFNGQPIAKLPDQEMADALIINAIFRIQKDLFVEHGHHDIKGMLTAYHMPVPYEDAFARVNDHGFIDAVEMTMREDGDFWENRGVSLN